MGIPVEIQEERGIRRATGHVRQGVIQIQVPKYWDKASKQEAIQYLTGLLEKKEAKTQSLLDQIDRQPPENFITLETRAELEKYVRDINRSTLNVPVAAVRIGTARYSRLAQMNLQSRVMTVSRFCLRGVPERALRYLIIHELAHLLEGSHNRRFWHFVAEHMPDYKKQSRIMMAFHKRAVDLAEEQTGIHIDTDSDIEAESDIPITSSALKIAPPDNRHPQPVIADTPKPYTSNRRPVRPERSIDIQQTLETLKQEATTNRKKTPEPRPVNPLFNLFKRQPHENPDKTKKPDSKPTPQKPDKTPDITTVFPVPDPTKRWWQLKLF